MTNSKLITINDVQIRFAKTIEEARQALAEGWCPIECSFGNESVVDDLLMDHHGELSHLKPVSIRAYQLLFGARSHDPRFVVTGNPGADDIFAILALAGLLPHPSRMVPEKQAHLRVALTKDLTPLAELIAKLDRDPVGVDKAGHPDGPMLILWGSFTDGQNGINRTIASLYVMHQLINGRPMNLYYNAAKEDEQKRRQLARDAERVLYGPVLLVNNSPVFGFDVWYGRVDDDTDPDSPDGWIFNVVVAYVAKTQKVTIGCPNLAVAEKLFGKGGLKNLWPLLDQEFGHVPSIGTGFGAAEAIGGSPRDGKLTLFNAQDIASFISKLLYNKMYEK